jgi:hypothetical protein
VTKICFRCKKEFGRFTLNSYPPNNLKADGKVVPFNMTNKDEVCHECYKEIPFTQKHIGFEKKLGKAMGICGLITAIVLLGLDCIWIRLGCLSSDLHWLR